MSTPLEFTIFDHVHIYRGNWASEYKLETTEGITCPADAEVQVRYGGMAAGLSVWFMRGEEILMELFLKNAVITELTETEVIFEGFERRSLMKGVYPFETTVWLMNSKILTGEN